MKTREEIKEIVKSLSQQECCDFMAEITQQNKVVLYGNWYSPKDIQEILEKQEPGFVRDMKIEGLLGDKPFVFEDFYEELGEHTCLCYEGPNDDFYEYVLPEFVSQYAEENCEED
jgi:hypothetical protein